MSLQCGHGYRCCFDSAKRCTGFWRPQVGLLASDAYELLCNVDFGCIEVYGVYLQARYLAAPESGASGNIHDSRIAARHILRKHVNLLVCRNVVLVMRNLRKSNANTWRYPDYPISNGSREQGSHISPCHSKCRRGEYFGPVLYPRAHMQGANANHLKTAERQRIDVQAEEALQALGSGVAVQQILTPCCAVVPDLHLTGFDVQGRSGVEFPFGFSVECSCTRLRE